MKSMNACPICSSGQTKHLLKIRQYSVHRCVDCGLIYATPLPSDEDLNKYYQGFLFKKPASYDIKKELKVRKRELKKLFQFSAGIANNEQKPTFLDFGGGTGVAYQAIKEMGFDVYYYDVDNEAKKYTTETFGLTEDQIIENVESCNKKFDFIFSDNVIEHIPDPKAFTDQLYKLLDKNGKLVIKTPHARNTETLFNPFISTRSYLMPAFKQNSFSTSVRAFFGRYWHCDPPRHIYSFSKKSFECLMKDLQISSYEISYYQVPWFENTLTKQFFSRDKRLKGIKSILVRILLLPLIPIEVLIQLTGKMLLALKIVTPGGIILTINKTN